MNPPLIYFLLFLAIAIIIEYFFFMRWQRYKKLISANNPKDFFSKNPDLPGRLFEGGQFEKLNRLQLPYFIILVAIGIIQIKTYIYDSYLWVGGLIYILLALVGFSRNILFLENAPHSQGADQIQFLNKSVGVNNSSTRSSYIQVLWFVVFTLLIFSIFSNTHQAKSTVGERASAATWIASVILGLTIVFWEQTVLKNAAISKMKNNPMEILPLVLIIILGFSMRIFLLTEHPYPFSGDEASIAMVSRTILRGEAGNFFETAWASQPIWSFLPTSLSTQILGDNIVGIRAASVIIGTMAVLFTYLAASEMFNSTIAIISGAFLATFPYNVHFSRIGVHNIMDSLMSSLVFWLIARSLRTQDLRLCYLAGVFGGLCAYTYAGTKLVPLLGIIILFSFLHNKQGVLPNRSKYVFFFIMAAIISAAPQVAYLAQDKNLLLGRLGQEGILFNGWLAQQAISQETSAIEIIWNQLTRTLLAFIALPASGIFYYSPKPYLTIIGSIFFLFGISFSWIQRTKPQYFSLLIWFWAVVLLGGVLTKDPPATTRMLMSTPAIAIFIGIGAHQIIKHLIYHKFLLERRLMIAVFAVIVLLSIQNIYFYMFEAKSNSYFQDATGEFAVEAGSMVKNLGDEYQIFIIGEPIVFSDFPTFRYLAPNNQFMNLNEKSMEELHLLKSQKYIFFAVPENHVLLEKIMEKYKGGQGGTFTRKTSQQPILFEYYILNKNN